MRIFNFGNDYALHYKHEHGKVVRHDEDKVVNPTETEVGDTQGAEETAEKANGSENVSETGEEGQKQNVGSVQQDSAGRVPEKKRSDRVRNNTRGKKK